MKTTNKEGTGVPGAATKDQGKRALVTKLPKMEMYAVLGLELSQQIVARLQKVEESVEIMARQKWRDLIPDSPADAPAR